MAQTHSSLKTGIRLVNLKSVYIAQFRNSAQHWAYYDACVHKVNPIEFCLQWKSNVETWQCSLLDSRTTCKLREAYIKEVVAKRQSLYYLCKSSHFFQKNCEINKSLYITKHETTIINIMAIELVASIATCCLVHSYTSETGSMNLSTVRSRALVNRRPTLDLYADTR